MMRVLATIAAAEIVQTGILILILFRVGDIWRDKRDSPRTGP